MGNILYGKIIVIADLLQAGNTCTFTSGSTVITKTVGNDGIVEAMLPAFKRWEVELDGYIDYVDLGCGECHTVNLALDKTTWQGIQNILDAHRETELLEIGDELTANIGGVDYIYQVGGINLYDSHEVIFVPKVCIGTYKHHTSQVNPGGWSQSDIRTYLNGTFKTALPSDIKNNLKTLAFKASSGDNSTSIITTDDDIWLPREYEIFGDIIVSKNTEAQYCRQYPIFTTQSQRVRTNNGVSTYWWSASPATAGTFCRIYYDGSTTTASNAANNYGLVPCFRFLANV